MKEPLRGLKDKRKIVGNIIRVIYLIQNSQMIYIKNKLNRKIVRRYEQRLYNKDNKKAPNTLKRYSMSLILIKI